MGGRGVRRIVAASVLLGLLVPLAATPVTAAAEAKIQAGLLTRLQGGDLDRFVVEFKAAADLRAAAAIGGWKARGAAVYRALTTTAARSQATARQTVRNTPGASASSFWLTNIMIVQGNTQLARRLAALPSVSDVREELTFPLVEPVESQAVLQAAADAAPPWGIQKIRAPQAWADGVLGGGVVVANVDTGVDFEHEALVNQYRGNLGGGTFDHNYNWWDPTGLCGDTPCDTDGHGTHTMGTMVGGDGPGPFTPDIGVAPGAQWIAAKGCEYYYCTEGSLVSAGEFLVAPTDLDGQNPDPSKRPDIINNSWGGEPGNDFYLEVVQAWRAAGIVPVFASGNPGPACGDGGSPGDFLESFSAGATNKDDQIADFSGRGPSAFGKINPDVTAPGVRVLSSVPGDDYVRASGTSMAAPHTAGTLALVLSSEPALEGQVDALTDAVRATAVDILDDSCGGDPDGDPNNVYGDGRVDAAAAVSLIASGGTLAGDVTDATTTDPIAGATIEASRNGRTYRAVTDAAGHYELFLAAGSYTVVTTAFGYQAGLVNDVTVQTDLTTSQDFYLAPLPLRDVTGTVTTAESGLPIEGAEVTAVGTPVAPTHAAADGTYTLTLPIGDFTLRTSAGGCTEPDEAQVSLTVAGLARDVALARKLDSASQGCRPIPFDWVGAANETPLFGDEVFGRFTLPFSFPFYDQTYDKVFVTDNGYLTFEPPTLAVPNPTPGTFPSDADPNAAIYVLWQNLVIDATADVRTDTIVDGADTAFVIEFHQLKVGPKLTQGTASTTLLDRRVDLEVKLWDDGRIDLLYGDNPADPGDGRSAAIGIENADGSDGLAFSVFDDLVSANVAYRYKTVPSGVVHGTVTDANDGLPVAGATVMANGVRATTTAADGTYSLRLYPGTYDLTTTSPGYADGVVSGFALDNGEDDTLGITLDAPAANLTPTSFDRSVGYGEQISPPLTIDNPGALNLHWQIYERDNGVTLPELPPVPTVTRSDVTWGPTPLPRGIESAHVDALPPEALETIIDDPDDDALASVENTDVRAGSDETDMTMALDFSVDTPMDQVVGYIFFDTDQNPKTGYPPEWFSGLPGQDIGLDYFADLFSLPSDGTISIWDQNFELVATVPGVIEGSSLSFTVPLAAFGNDDGDIDTAMVLGDFNQPTDWAPDEGHGTIRAFTDAPWMTPAKTKGVVQAGQSKALDLTLGSESLPPGEYSATMVMRTNAPRSPAVTIEVALEVRKPASWGAGAGSVRDAHEGFRLSDAKVIVHAKRNGDPLDLTAHTDEKGRWSLQGPEGTWPAQVHRNGYVPESLKVTIVRDVTTDGYDVKLHAAVPHAQLSTGPVDLTLLHGEGATITRVLRNTEGHRPLVFEIGEVNVPPGTQIGGGGGGGGGSEPPGPYVVPADANLGARTSRSVDRNAPIPSAELLSGGGGYIDKWPTHMTLPWGVGYRSPGLISISDAEDVLEDVFTTQGEQKNEFDLSWADSWAGDLAWDEARGVMWHVNVGGDNGIYGIDPTDGSVVDVITGTPWGGISQRGLAYDPATDTFYIGGWNEGIVYQVAGPSWPTPGETIDSCQPDDGNISGLAWNPAFQKLWEATNSRHDTIWLIDPRTCEAERAIEHPDPRYNGAGLEMDAVGNLWTVSQDSRNAYLLASGLPTFSDVPWLTVRPGKGEIQPGHNAELTIHIDTDGVAPGSYRAFVAVKTNDPAKGVFTIPIHLLLTKYQRHVNVGGADVTFGDGTGYVADRPFRDDGFGYVGDSSSKRVDHTIAATRYQAVFRSQRYGMDAYRFTVPDGRYRVTLEFAELTAGVGEFDRIMDIYAQGDLVLDNLDVAARVGRYQALTRTFRVQVKDGTLRLRFDRANGRPPMLNGVRVTWLSRD